MSAPWILVLGVSSGFGAAAARAFAAAGYDVAGVHLDRRAGQALADTLAADIRAMGRQAVFFNVNAADDDRRAETLAALGAAIPAGGLRVFLHSLAFGTLKPYVPAPGADEKGATRKQVEMTLDVMGHSLIYWTQDLVAAGLFSGDARIYAMTSSGSHMVWPRYGMVSAAKAALEAHIRQLAIELAPRGITANAILAGVTPTAALEKIPGADKLVAQALARNPNGRLTTPEDVAACLVDLARPGTHWMNGNVIRVDGGEDCAG
ncbi:MAG: SDR family oxidoreductase [Pseudomonadota bacterium]|nr:SDR family oxidoreductase [Pseudomonadota bacterium]